MDVLRWGASQRPLSQRVLDNASGQLLAVMFDISHETPNSTLQFLKALLLDQKDRKLVSVFDTCPAEISRISPR